MFDLDKLIQMVKKGDLSGKPFNIKKKSWDDEDIRRTTDSVDTEQGYEVDFDTIDEGDDSSQLNIQTLQTPEQISKNKQIQYEMDVWIKNNLTNLKIESQEVYDVLERKMVEVPET